MEIEFDFGRGVMFDGGEIVPQRPINGLRCLEIFFCDFNQNTLRNNQLKEKKEIEGKKMSFLSKALTDGITHCY